MKCPNCHAVVDPNTAWKSSANRFYCSEFCADIEAHDASEARVTKDEIDRQYIERLQRLLPYMRERAGVLPLGSGSSGIG